MEEHFYYYRDEDNRPLVTVCLLTDGINYSRGVAICSVLDNVSKQIGKKIAKSRALSGLKLDTANNMLALIKKSDILTLLAYINYELPYFKIVKNPVAFNAIEDRHFNKWINKYNINV